MKCTYCGEHGDSLDHVIPHSYDHVYKKRSYNRKEVVPACTECNSLLGNKLYFTIKDRAGYLHSKYQKRYKKILAYPVWDEEDLDEMSDNFRKSIVAGLDEAKIIKIRIGHCDLVRSTAPSIDDIWADIEEDLN